MIKRHHAKAHTGEATDLGQAFERLRLWLGELYFNESGKWFPVPDWAKFFFEIGATLSSLDADNTRFVFAISVPTRAYATTLIAAGHAALRALVPTDTPQDHLQLLQSLKAGTPVVLYWSGKKYNKAALAGRRFIGGDVYFGVKPEKATTVYISAQDADKIQISERETVNLPKHQSGRNVGRHAALLKSVLDSRLLLKFTYHTRVECVAIGQVNVLIQELQTPLAHKSVSSKYEEGRLQDLLRAHELTQMQKDIPYRSRLLPTRAPQSRALAEKLSPPAVIFDGVAGFVKWSDVWSCTNQVVILDRTEREYEYGIATINRQYAERLDGRAPSLPVMPAPPGVEMMFYRLSL